MQDLLKQIKSTSQDLYEYADRLDGNPKDFIALSQLFTLSEVLDSHKDSSVDDLIEIILSKTEKVSELEKQVFKLKKKLNADKDYDKICLKIEKKEEKLQEITENLQTLRKEVRKLRKEKKELLEDLKAQF